MKRFWEKLTKNSTWIIFLVMLFLFMPVAFNKEPQTDVKAIMTAVGIDKNDDEYEVSCLMVIPTTEKDPNSDLHLVSAKGLTISQAINQLSHNIGKEVGLAHCDIIIMNDEAIEDNITKTLDFFIRGYNITKKAYVVNCPEGAKEMLSTVMKDKSVSAILLANLVNSEDNAVMGVGSDIDLIYRNYFEKSGVNRLNVFELEKNDEGSQQSSQSNGQESGSDSSTSSGGGSGQGEEKKLVSNNKLVFLKNGVKSCEIEQTEATLYSIYKGQIDRGYLFLDNVNDNEKENAKMGVDLVKIKRNNDYVFENGKPTIKCNITLVVALHEIYESETNVEQADNTKTHISKEVKDEIKKKFSQSAERILSVSKENKTDIYEFYNKFYKYKNKEWKKYLEGLESSDEYLQDCQVKLSIKIKDKF